MSTAPNRVNGPGEAQLGEARNRVKVMEREMWVLFCICHPVLEQLVGKILICFAYSLSFPIE